mmetsp:Transcript_46281/g.122834  ORF Transcript_46281/g.122834 Transcript_46281/m.122834 type:complete len:100 (+) Transcript_46281:2336-2635(+)
MMTVVDPTHNLEMRMGKRRRLIDPVRGRERGPPAGDQEMVVRILASEATATQHFHRRAAWSLVSRPCHGASSAGCMLAVTASRAVTDLRRGSEFGDCTV